MTHRGNPGTDGSVRPQDQSSVRTAASISMHLQEPRDQLEKVEPVCLGAKADFTSVAKTACWRLWSKGSDGSINARDPPLPLPLGPMPVSKVCVQLVHTRKDPAWTTSQV